MRLEKQKRETVKQYLMRATILVVYSVKLTTDVDIKTCIFETHIYKFPHLVICDARLEILNMLHHLICPV